MSSSVEISVVIASGNNANVLHYIDLETSLVLKFLKNFIRGRYTETIHLSKLYNTETH